MSIKEEMQHILEELKILQSYGVYNRNKINELKARRTELQNICPHENVKEIPGEEGVFMCEDCGKILYR